jgi:hypothetical protein
MHVEAVDLIRQDSYAKALPLLEKVYKDTPAEKRNRALVMNRAIVDVMQKRLIMRAIRDLTVYLTKHRDEDEPGTNLLGGALNVAVLESPKLVDGDVWQAGLHEWERRNYLLDHSRKGYRRWGAKWVTDAEYKHIEDLKEELRLALIDAQERTDRANTNANSLILQYQNAADAKYAYDYTRAYLMDYANRQTTNQWDALFAQQHAGALIEKSLGAAMEARRLGPEVAAAIQEFNKEFAKLIELQKKVIRPEWPTQFEPVDPSGSEAEQAIRSVNPVPVTQPAEKDFIPGFKPLPPPRKSLYKQ